MHTISSKPLTLAIPYHPAIHYATLLKENNNLVFLDSAQSHPTLGRYSYIAFAPFATFILRDNKIYWNDERIPDQHIFDKLAHTLRGFQLNTDPTLPPFQGGAAGLFSYDLVRHLEDLPHLAVDDAHYPELALGFYDLVLSFDHVNKNAWLISSGLPEAAPDKQKARAEERLAWALEQLNQPIQKKDISISPVSITSHFNQSTYMQAVEQAKEYILSGDIFEVNLSQRFQCELPPNCTPFDLYCRLRTINPAPFSAFVRFDDTTIASSSPERFLALHQGHVETRPIKGTIRRSSDPGEDQQLAMILQQSQKDRAENTMIVDLMRNDLSRACLPHSIKVPQYCAIESYETVHHLVSVVIGELAPHHHAIDLLRATFPGGSVTGAPKIRAMEIIDTLEPTRRGPYCGSVGYIGFDDCMDLSILIRTYTIKDNQIHFQAGGAIVLASNPEEEYAETLLKAAALQRVLS